MDSEPRRQPDPNDDDRRLAQLMRFRGTIVDLQAKIHEQRALLEECERALDHAAQNMPHPDQFIDDTLAKLRAAQEQDA